MGFTVLLYHRVHPKFGLPPEKFREQMVFLKKRFKVLTLEELEKSPSFPSVLVTFDDGFADFLFFAFPVLKELSIPSVLFVPPERVFDSEAVRKDENCSNVSTYEAFKNSFLKGDNSPFLSWGELRYLQSTGLVSVESHALTHRGALGKGKPYKPGKDWRIYSLSKREREKVKEETQITSVLISDYEKARKELKLSKEILEEKLDKEVRALSWPWGIYDEKLIKIAREVGYEFCFTTERGFNRDTCRIKRLAVSEKKGMFWFKTRTLFYSL